jgi:hypothetical protein
MYVNGKIKPVETILGMREEGRIDRGRNREIILF